jgi:hypothetical protein
LPPVACLRTTHRQAVGYAYRNKFFIVSVLVVVTLICVSCGSTATTNQEKAQAANTSAHQASPELEQRIVADASEDLQIIASSGKDSSRLAKALTGKALEDTKSALNKDLAQGKYKQRHYQNINVRMTAYTAPVAEVFAEFDDNSYYVDASSGAALTQPALEHKSYALALVEEEGRWKIMLILSPSANTTPRQ